MTRLLAVDPQCPAPAVLNAACAVLIDFGAAHIGEVELDAGVNHGPRQGGGFVGGHAAQ